VKKCRWHFCRDAPDFGSVRNIVKVDEASVSSSEQPLALIHASLLSSVRFKAARDIAMAACFGKCLLCSLDFHQLVILRNCAPFIEILYYHHDNQYEIVVSYKLA